MLGDQLMTATSAGRVRRSTRTPTAAAHRGPGQAPQTSTQDTDPRTQLVELIVSQIRFQGYFRTCLPSVSEQDVVDIRWTAQLAGRALERPVRTHVRHWDGPRPSMTVIIAPAQARTEDEVELQTVAQATIQWLHAEGPPSVDA